MPTGSQDDLSDAIENLQVLIAERVRLEQRRDQLTGLPNNLAVMADLADRIKSKSPFWVAFIEVDRFKSLNSRFGHVNADAVLQGIARIMHGMCSCFTMKTTAYRAHGDEFFYVGFGAGSEADGRALDVIRSAIAEIKITTEGDVIGVMSCTVSVGWLRSGDLDPKAVLTERVVLDAAERAVSEAKRKRNCVVQYSTAMSAEDWVSLRTDCNTCYCRFSMDVKREHLKKNDKLSCPNCST